MLSHPIPASRLKACLCCPQRTAHQAPSTTDLPAERTRLPVDVDVDICVSISVTCAEKSEGPTKLETADRQFHGILSCKILYLRLQRSAIGPLRFCISTCLNATAG